MRYEELNENLEPSYYMEEGCGIFAVALSSLFPGGQIYIFSDTNGEEWDEEIPFEVTHVVYKYDDKIYDVTGETDISNLKKQFHVHNYNIKGPYDEINFEERFMGDTDDKPLYGSKSDVEEAIKYIKDNNYKIKKDVN